jgi:hypothetical protein
MEPEERSPYRPDYRPESEPEEKAGFFAEAREWAAGRSPWARLLLCLYLAWVFCHHLGDPLYKSWFGGLNLGIHELGHILAVPLGTFIQVAAGTLAQCLAPIASAFVFHRQRDWFAIGFSSAWLGINLFEVATYAGDAAVQELPLVSPFAGVPLHDWNYLLGKLGLLDHAAGVASLFRLGGSLFILAGLGFSSWLIVEMLRARPARSGD